MKKTMPIALVACALLFIVYLMASRGNHSIGYIEVTTFKYKGTSYHIFVNKNFKGKFHVTKGFFDTGGKYYTIYDQDTNTHIETLRNKIRGEVDYYNNLQLEQKEYLNSLISKEEIIDEKEITND